MNLSYLKRGSFQPAAYKALQDHAAFFIAFSLWLSLQILMRSLWAQYIDDLYLPFRFLSLAIVVLGDLASCKFDERKIMPVAIAMFFLIAAFQSTMNIMIDIIVFIYCARNVPFRTIARISLIVICLIVSVVFLSAWIGVIENYVSLTATRTRTYLGFRYALYPSQFIFMVTCLAVYLYRNRIPFIVLLGLLIVNYSVYSATDSRLSFYLSVGLIIASTIFRFTGKKVLRTKLFGITASSMFILAAIASISLAIAYDPFNPILTYLDQYSLLGGRLRLGNSALQTYGIPLFGQKVDLVGNALTISGTYERIGDYNYIDSLFIQMIVRYGLLSTLLFISLLTAITWHAWKVHDWGLVIVLIFIALHCVFDDLSLYLYFNPFLFLIARLFPDKTQLSNNYGFHVLKNKGDINVCDFC